MEDEILKRNTDCVYFLASPLTCKKDIEFLGFAFETLKINSHEPMPVLFPLIWIGLFVILINMRFGNECEYRHSESARLNPRDCWYWLDGNCLNQTCVFRHPPLDVRTETSSECAPLPQQSSVLVNKTNVPCYFYFNGFCNKGDRCSFLHGIDGVSSALKSSKSASTATDVHPLENKTSIGSDMGPVSRKETSNPSDTALKAVSNVQFQPKEDLQQSVANNFMEQSPSLQISMPVFQEIVVKSDSLLPAEDFIESRSLLCQDLSSEEEMDGHREPEERWESSPGFDVLVDDGSENLGYEDDPEYLLAHDREDRGLHNHLLGYDFEDRDGYGAREYPDAVISYEHSVYDSYNCLENGDVHDYVQSVHELSRDRMLDPMFRKRKLLRRELEVDGLNGVDLRDHLRKRRRIDGRRASSNPRRQGLSLNDRRSEWPGRHGKDRMLHGRLASEVGKNMIRSHRENETGSNDADRGGISRLSQSRRNRPRQRDKFRRRHARSQFLPSEISSNPDSREMRRPSQEFTTFMGPKTLSQIKEEKRKARENGDDFENTGRLSRITSGDFQGPKPLSKILKDKRRLGSISDDNSNSRLKHNHAESEKSFDYLVKDDNDSVDEDNEDDGGLEKKLASIFS
ncbi:hypothetical protein HHK36_021484 [Tetracentron sinense]|uniref:C3H1-type domain-containing protein n=1 Tax=Tetracentron sinense TaxID=13715 RepID=A0A835D742_TETSI|nr:hypothetical protein HHK36_021484 [Tetracentron sinense]